MDTLEYWQEKLAEFQAALTAENEDVPESTDDMKKLLKAEIEHCEEQIEALS